MANRDEKTCEPDPKDDKSSHTCEHGRSVPNRPGDLADEYRRQTGHY